MLGSAQGSFVEVASSTLSITKTDGLSDGDKIVAGVDNVEFMKFVLDNNDSGDVNVTSVTVQGLATGKSRTLSNYTLAVYVDGVQQGSAKNLKGTSDGDATTASCGTSGSSGDCTATFNDLSVVIPSAGQKEFVVVVDTIEDSADVTTQTATAVTENSVTVPTIVGNLFSGDTLIILEEDGDELSRVIAAGGIDTTTNVVTFEDGTALTTTVAAIPAALAVIETNDVLGVVEVAEIVGVTGIQAVAEIAGVTKFTIDIAGIDGDILTLSDDSGDICVITFTDNGTPDSDCADDGKGLIDSAVGTGTDTKERQVVAIAAFTFDGYVASENGATETDDFDLTDQTPFINGNVIGTPTVGSTLGITFDNITQGVEAVTGISEVVGVVAVAGTYGDTTFTIDTAGVSGDKLTLTDGEGDICVISFTDGGPADNDCAGGAVIDSTANVTATEQANEIAGFTFTGYTASINGASDTTFDLIKKTIFIAGNSVSAESGPGERDVEGPKVTLKHTMELQVNSVLADNIENGQTVEVKEATENLTSSNSLEGTMFELVQSGRLTVSSGQTVDPDILIANQENVEVLKIRLVN